MPGWTTSSPAFVERASGEADPPRVLLAFDDIAQNRRVPPVGVPRRNSEPFLRGTAISAILAAGSRWGARFDEVRDEDGATAATPSANAAAVATYRAAGFEAPEEASDLRQP